MLENKNNTEFPRILHLDDNRDFLEMFYFMFKKNFNITSMEDPSNALENLEKEEYDVIIIDYEMPEMNGLDFLRKVKEEHPDISLIFYTGQGNEEIAREAFILGASDYFTKELRGFAHREKLLNSINRAIETGKVLKEKKKSDLALRESEERYRTLAETVPCAIYRCQPGVDGVMEFISRYILNISGYPDSDFIDNRVRSFDSIIFPADIPYIEAVVAEAISRQKPWTLDYRIIHRDGSVRWVYEEGKALFDEHGNVMGLDGVIIDNTDRKRASEEVQHLRNLLSNIVNSMPSTIVGVDLEEKVIQWNRRAEQVTGVPSADAIGKPLLDVFPGIMKDTNKIKRAIRQGKIQEELRVPRASGDETRYEDITVYPLETNTVEGAVIRVDDVTERVKIEDMMVQSEKMISMGELASGVAHSINDPLAGIIQNAYVLKSRLTGDFPANRLAAEESGLCLECIEKYLEKRNAGGLLGNILESGNQAMKVVQNILSFTGKSESQMPLQSIPALLDRTIELARQDYDLKSKYDFRKIKITREYEPNLPYIPCESGKIQLAFLNILKTRALYITEYSHKNEFIPEFFIRVCQGENSINIEIEDNGPEMGEAALDEIFKPFYILTGKALKENAALALSYFIISEIHRGIMKVESSDEQGVKFKISLPFKGGISIEH